MDCNHQYLLPVHKYMKDFLACARWHHVEVLILVNPAVHICARICGCCRQAILSGESIVNMFCCFNRAILDLSRSILSLTFACLLCDV